MPHLLASDQVLPFIEGNPWGDIVVVCQDPRWTEELAKATISGLNKNGGLIRQVQVSPPVITMTNRTVRFVPVGRRMQGLLAYHVLVVVPDEIAYTWTQAFLIELTRD